jgi:hypothetical protein
VNWAADANGCRLRLSVKMSIRTTGSRDFRPLLAPENATASVVAANPIAITPTCAARNRARDTVTNG